MTRAILTPGNMQSEVTRKRRWTPPGVLVYIVGFIVVGGMLISVMLPSLCRSTETANRVKCAANLKALGSAIYTYAQSHAGHYPPSLAVLPLTEDISAYSMVCPSSNDEASTTKEMPELVADLIAAETGAAGHKHCLSYLYAGQSLTSSTATERSIVAFESLDNHDKDGVNVLFGDGHVEFITKESWPKMAKDAGIVVANAK